MRNEIERRPLLACCLALIVGLAISENPLHALFFLPFALLADVRLRAAASAFLILGYAISPPGPVDPELQSRFFSGRIRVASMPRLGPSSLTFRGEAGEEAFLVVASRESGLALGDELQTEGLVRPLREGSERTLLAQGLEGTLLVSQAEVVRRGHGLFRAGAAWLGSFAEYSERAMSPAAAQIVQAITFNLTGGLSDETRLNLQRSGTMHIVAASGMHVGLLSLGLLFLLARLPLPRWAQLLIAGAILLVYAAGAGFRPPVVRAVLMAGLLLSAFGWRREPDLGCALAAAALIYLLSDPAAAFTPGFQLSFLTIAAIGFFVRWDRFRAEGRGWLAQRALGVAAISAVATLASGPIVAYYFGLVSVVSVIANVLIAGVLPALMAGSMLGWLVSLLSAEVGAGIALLVVEPLAGWTLLVVDTLGAWDLAAVNVPPFSPYWLLIYYGFFAAIWRKRARPV
jgi:ComEC/Rec2-related protein